MRKILFILSLLVITSFAEESMFNITDTITNTVKSVKKVSDSIVDIVSDKPKWLRDIEDGKFEFEKGDTLYFIGRSTLHKKTELKIANQEANKDALSQIANYISVSVGSKTTIVKHNSTDGYSASSNKSIDTLSFVELDGIVPFKVYSDKQDDDTIIYYSLYKISKDTLDKKRDEYKKKDEEYAKLMKEFTTLVQTNQISLAKELSFKINGYKRSQYDNEYKRLVSALKDAFDVELTLSSKKFKLNEYVKISLKPSKTVYVYLLLEYGNGKNIQMLFPSRFDSQNYLTAKKIKKIKKFKITKQHLTKTHNTIILYSSSSPIDFSSYLDERRRLSNKEDAAWRHMIEKRLENSIIYTKKYPFEVINKKATKKSVCIKVDGRGFLVSELKKQTKKILKKHFRIRDCRRADYSTTIIYEDTLEDMEDSNQKIRIITYSFSLENKEGDELFSTDEKVNRFLSKAKKRQIIKEIRSDLKSDLSEIIATIKE